MCDSTRVLMEHFNNVAHLGVKPVQTLDQSMLYRNPLAIKAEQSRSRCKNAKQHLQNIRSPCAALSLQQHPEVNKATRKRWSDWRQAERTSTFYIIAVLATQYLQPGHKVFLHVLFALQCCAIIWSAIVTGNECIVHQIQLLSFDSSKSCRMWKKKQPESEIWLKMALVFRHCAPVLFWPQRVGAVVLIGRGCMLSVSAVFCRAWLL